MGRLFGTNGIRGVINEGLTVEMALDIGRSVGTFSEKGKIVISRDSRMGSVMFTKAVVSGIVSTGCPVIDIGPAPTPTLQFMVPHLDCTAGVMITASHNPPEFNGIKVMGRNGIEITRELEAKVEEIYFSREFYAANWQGLGSIRTYDKALTVYLEAVKTHVNVNAIRKRNLTVVVDGANSAGALATPRLMREMGCKVISLNSQMDGMFPGRLPEPTPDNLKELSRVVKSVGADLGIAHDGDADRAAFVDEKGRVLWGDQSFAILASRVLARKKKSTLVTPVSSGRLIEDVAKNAGANVVWTEVGSVVVSHKLEEIGAELGGEENGGVFYPPHQSVRDGPLTAAQIVDIMAFEGKSLSQLVSELPGPYYSHKAKVEVPPKKKDTILDILLETTKDEERITLDGVKLVYDEGWILMRPSGTEPIWRCFAEGISQKIADLFAEKGVKMIESAIKAG